MDRASAPSYVALELLSAMAVAEEAGAEPFLFDVNRRIGFKALSVGPSLWRDAASALAEGRPDLVLFETGPDTMHSTLALADEVWRAAPDAEFVFAGAGTSAIAERTLAAFPWLDGVIRGDMEPAVGALSRGLVASVAPETGLVRRMEGRIVSAPLASVSDLGALPRPAFRLGLIPPGETLPLEAGRGGVQGGVLTELGGRGYRPRAPEALAADMLGMARRFPGSSLDLSRDRDFFDDPGRLRALCKRLAGGGVRFTCHARPDRLDLASLHLLARAGCMGILFGVESLGKSVALDRVERTVREAVGLGMVVRASFMVGRPDEGKPALEQTAALLFRMRSAGAGETRVQVARALPGTAWFERFRDKLEFEPLFCPAPASDEEGRARIKARPWLHAASYRMPMPLGRDATLSTWLGLSAFPGTFAVLEKAGLATTGLASRIEARIPDRLDEAVDAVGDAIAAAVERSERHEGIERSAGETAGGSPRLQNVRALLAQEAAAYRLAVERYEGTTGA